MGERYHQYIYCYGIENHQCLSENLCLIMLESSETPIACCSALGESLRFVQRFTPFSSHFLTMRFCTVEFTDTSSAGKTVRKVTEILQSSDFLLE